MFIKNAFGILFPLVMGTLFFIPVSAWPTPVQPMRHSQQCYGRANAERLFEQAMDFELARNNQERDVYQAERLYEQALNQGSAKAALYLGRIYRQSYVKVPGYSSRLRFQIALFERAIALGCPDGYFFLAEAYQNGWGVHSNLSMAWDLIRTGAQKGSMAAMTAWGLNVYFEHRFEKDPLSEAKRKEGKRWLEQALAKGYGVAGYELAMIYRVYEHDPANAIRALRTASRLGNLEALYMLAEMYRNGEDGQRKDPAYAAKIDAIRKKINPLETPTPIQNFDQQLPPKKVLPFLPQQPRLSPAIVEEQGQSNP